MAIAPILLTLTGIAWLVLEIGLRLRDDARGKGGTGRDRGTRALNFGLFVVAVVVADVLSFVIGKHSPLWIPGAGNDGWPIAVGLVVIWLGLAIRVWAIVVLGRSFRTTVEVDAGQAVVSHGLVHWPAAHSGRLRARLRELARTRHLHTAASRGHTAAYPG
jgi:hypothetical protein